MKDDEADETPRPFEVVVPDQPPVVTPGLAAALLRLIRRRHADRSPAQHSPAPPPPPTDDGVERKAS